MEQQKLMGVGNNHTDLYVTWCDTTTDDVKKEQEVSTHIQCLIYPSLVSGCLAYPGLIVCRVLFFFAVD